MEKVFELKRKVAEVKTKLRAIKKRAEDDEMTEDDPKDAGDLRAELEKLSARVAALESVEDDDEDDKDDKKDEVEDEAPQRKSKPVAFERSRFAPAAHTKKHEYSLLRAIKCQIDGRFDGYEREVSDEIATRTKKKAQGFYMPTDLTVRSLSLTTGAGDITTYLDKTIVELLRNKTVIFRMGARVLNDMIGSFAIPRQSGAATYYMVAEGSSPTGSNQTIDQVAFAGKTIGAYTDITRKFLLQANLDAENFVRSDLVEVLARGIDFYALNGTGSSNQPTGILQNGSIANVPLGTNGDAPTWASMVEMEEQVAIANADLGKLGYVFNAQGRSTLKTTNKSGTTYPVFIWDDDNRVNGYDAFVSQQIPANLTKGSGTGLSAGIFGNWDDLVVAFWSGLDILVDPYTGSSSGTVRVVALQDFDVNVRHTGSFCTINDMSTT